MPSARRPPKVQRWIDLIAALLRFHYPIAFDTIANEVPAYAAATKKRDAVMRMFERDKDELRALGIPIEAVANEDGVPDRYRLRSKDFYLPYLSIIEEGRAPTAPAHPKGYGYQGLPALAFEPDELEFVARAAQRVQQLGDPHLAHEASAAIRKLAFDVAIASEPKNELVTTDHGANDPDVLAPLDDAIRRRKTAAFEYRSMERDALSRRTIEPLGLVFMSGAWYLVARDTDAAALRHFRTQRIRNVAVNASRPQTPDFETPLNFDLSTHAASRNAWELGDGDAIDAIVAFTGDRGAVAHAMELGEPIENNSDRRCFRVRRVESFARWLLSFGGEAQPIEPAEVVDAWRDLARRTAAVYGDRP